ncbi:MAG TPA: type II toxin-antitoxin system VapC family toxin [Pyrinomonadaceae bacterium]|jgi:PIN domain nuclease of toxin-antitoxin system
MRLLLDTHTFIWWFSEPEKLSTRAQNLLADAANELLLSVVSVWEMQIKIQLGKLRLTIPLRELIEGQEQTNGLQILPVQLEHVLALEALPARHKDPFDRLLIVQADAEEAYLVSMDKVFSDYSVKLLW